MSLVKPCFSSSSLRLFRAEIAWVRVVVVILIDYPLDYFVCVPYGRSLGPIPVFDGLKETIAAHWKDSSFQRAVRVYNCWSLKHCRQRMVLVFSTQTKGEAQLAVSLTDSNLASFLKWYGKVAEQQLSKKMAIRPPLNQYPCASLSPFSLSSWHVDCPSTYRRCKESEVCQVGSGETPASSPGF